eukprot:6436562-Pyramimonas_sp.AAC.1
MATSSIPALMPMRPPLLALKILTCQLRPPAMMQQRSICTGDIIAPRRRRRHVTKPARISWRAVRRVFCRWGEGRGDGGRRARRLHCRLLAQSTNYDFEDLFLRGEGRGKGRR